MPVETKPCETALYDPCQPADLESSLPALKDPQLPTVSQELAGKLAALVAGQSGGSPASNLEPATGSETFAAPTRLAIGMLSLASFYPLVPVEAANAPLRWFSPTGRP